MTTRLGSTCQSKDAPWTSWEHRFLWWGIRMTSMVSVLGLFLNPTMAQVYPLSKKNSKRNSRKMIHFYLYWYQTSKIYNWGFLIKQVKQHGLWREGAKIVLWVGFLIHLSCLPMYIFKIVGNALDAQTGVLRTQDSRVNTLFNQTAFSQSRMSIFSG